MRFGVGDLAVMASSVFDFTNLEESPSDVAQ
jgi:hypothetical protein